MAIKLGTQTAGIMLVTADGSLSSIALLDTNPIDPVSRLWSISYWPDNLVSAPTVTNATSNPATFTPPAAGEWYVVRLVRTLLVGTETLELPICVPDATGVYALPPPGVPADTDPTKTIVNLNDDAKIVGWAGAKRASLPGLAGAVRKALADAAAAVSPASAIAAGTQSAGQWSRVAGNDSDVKELGAKGDGTTNDFAALQTAAASNPGLQWSSGAYKVATTGNIGIAASVHDFKAGAVIHAAIATPLTIRGQIRADKTQQIFAVDAPGAIILSDVTEIHPGWFGAKGNANYLHTDFKWYTDSSHSVEATDDSATVAQCLAAISGRASAGLPTTVHVTGAHYLKTPGATPTGPFSNKMFFSVSSFTRYLGDGGYFRLGPGLQTADYAIFLGTTDLQSVCFENLHFHCNADDTTSPSVGGHTTASTQRNMMIALLGAHNDDIRIDRCLFEKHAGQVPTIVADFTSSNIDQLGKGVHYSDCTFREIGNVTTLVDHISIYMQADGGSIIGCNFYNDPATNAHSKDFGGTFQIQGRSIAVVGNRFTNVPSLGIFASFFNINSNNLSFVGNTVEYVPVGLSIVQAVGTMMSDVVVSGNSGTMTNCSVGQAEGFIQTFGLNGGDIGIDHFAIVGNSIRFVHDARYADAEPIALSFDVPIRSMLVEGNDFSDWPNGAMVISPIVGTNPNNRTPMPPYAPATLVAGDLKVWDVHVRHNRFKNCGVGATTINIVCDTTNKPLRRISITGNVIEAVDRTLRISSATNAATIVVTTCDEISGAALAHGLVDATPVTISGVDGNTNANVVGYAKVTGYSSTTFGLFSNIGLTTPVAGNATYTRGGIVQCPQTGNITTGVVISGSGEDLDCDPDSNFFRNVTTPVTFSASGNGMTRAYAGQRGLTLDDGTLSQGRVSYDSSTFSAAITGSFRLSKVLALANSQPIYGIDHLGTTVYPLIGIDVNDAIRIASTARIVGIGPLTTIGNAVAKDLVLCKGGSYRRENNAQSAALLLLDSDATDYVRSGFDVNVAGWKAYAAGSLVAQVDGSGLALPTSTQTISIGGADVFDRSTNKLRIGFNITTTGLEVYAAGSKVGDFTTTSFSAIYGGGATPLKADASAVYVNGGAGLGSGVGLVSIANATTAPTADPTSGGLIYEVGGALIHRGSSGTVTTVAPS